MPINKKEKLYLIAEMKLPGEAWLSLEIIGNTIYQSATFRPDGIWGKLYWYSVVPFSRIYIQRNASKIVTNYVKNQNQYA
jgi:hypothetical protein